MNRRGISLIEALLALAVLVTSFFVLTTFPSALRCVQRARELSQATFLAQSAMEAQKLNTFDQVAGSSANATVTATVSGQTQALVYTTQVTVTNVNSTAKIVVAQVSWTSDRAQSVSLVTELVKLP